MKAELESHELVKVFAFVCKGARGKEVRERAKALLVFGNDGLCVEFNDLSVTCPAQVSETGKYALNPFVFSPMIETFGKTKITIEITKDAITVGRLQVAHSRVHGWFDRPETAIQTWDRYRSMQLDKRQKRIKKETEWKATERRGKDDKLRDARYVAFKRTDGGIEYAAAVLKYERGAPGDRKVLVKTKDFQEVWISELEIVSYGREPEINVK